MAVRLVFYGADAAIRKGSAGRLLATGEGVAVGMGAVVIADVSADGRAFGNPARPR